MKIQMQQEKVRIDEIVGRVLKLIFHFNAGGKENGIWLDARNSDGCEFANSSRFAIKLARSRSHSISTAMGSKALIFTKNSISHIFLFKYRRLLVILPFTQILTVAMAL
jgi:hypothetical protein